MNDFAFMLNYIIWDIDPNLSIGGSFSILWYKILFGLACVVGMQMLDWMFKRENAPRSEFIPHIAIIFFCSMIGARLMHVFFYEFDYYIQHPFEILYIWEGGTASHGAALGVIIGILIYAKWKGKIWYWWTFDRIAIIIPIASGIIRIGNLLNSELYGKVTEVPWAFVFVYADPLPRHPVQLYEVANLILISIVMLLLYLKTEMKEKFGRLSGVMLIMLTIGRFISEFFKEHETSLLDLNMGQLLSIPFFILGIVLVQLSSKGKLNV